MPAAIRTCKTCGLKAPREVMLRFVWGDRGPVLDVKKQMSGRGAYCCNREECMSRFLGREKKWKNAFRL